MAIVSGSKRARSYVRKHMKALNLIEHRGLDWENVAETELDDKFHIESEEINGLAKGQVSQPVEVNLVVRFWTKPRADEDPTDALEKNHDTYDSILRRILDLRNMGTDGIKNVILDQYLPVAISSDNNQIIRGELSLDIALEFCYEDPTIV